MRAKGAICVAGLLLLGAIIGIRDHWVRSGDQARMDTLEGQVTRLFNRVEFLEGKTARMMRDTERLTRASRATSEAWETVYESDVPGTMNPYDNGAVKQLVTDGKVRPGMRNLFDIPPILR